MGEPTTWYRTVHVCRGGYTIGWLGSALGGAWVMWVDPLWLGLVLFVVTYGVGLKIVRRNCRTEPPTGHETAGG